MSTQGIQFTPVEVLGTVWSWKHLLLGPWDVCWEGWRPRDLPLWEHVCTKMMQDLKGTWIGLTVNNFFTSLNLARMLLQWDITLVGTIRANLRATQFSIFIHSWITNTIYVIQSYKAAKVRMHFSYFNSCFNVFYTGCKYLLSSQHKSPQVC